jgi:hypothetical protein
VLIGVEYLNIHTGCFEGVLALIAPIKKIEALHVRQILGSIGPLHVSHEHTTEQGCHQNKL